MAAARRVLLIDADPHFLETLKRTLHPYGVEVDVVNDGSDGLGRVAELAPELIFIAVDLPDKAGYSICNKAKKGVAKSIPVVLATATVPPAALDDHRKLKARADDYIDKRTLTVDDLLHKVDALIGLGPMVEEVPIEDIPVEAEEIAFEEDAIALEESPIDSGQMTAADGFAIESTSVNVDPGIDAETEAVFAGLVETTDDSFAEPATNVRHPTPPPIAPPPRQPRPVTQPPSATRPFPPMPPRPPATPPPSPPATPPPLAVAPAPSAPARIAEVAPPPPPPPAREAEAPAPEPIDLGLDSVGDRFRDDPATARIAELEGELARVRAELTEAKKGGSTATPFSREREFLNLREVINRKEKEILDLREESDNRDRQILAGRDKVRELDKRHRETEERLLVVEGNLVTANESIAALRDDKEKALEREKGLKARIEIAQAQLRKADEEFENLKRRAAADSQAMQQELTAKKADHEREKRETVHLLGDLKSQHATTLKQAEEQKLAAIAALTKQLTEEREAATAALREELTGEMQRLKQQHLGTLTSMREEHARQLAALQHDRDEALVRAARDKQDAVERAATDKAQALAEADRRLRDELGSAEDRRQTDLAAAEDRRAREVAAKTEEMRRALADRDAIHSAEVEKLENENAAALAAAEERRQHETTSAEDRRAKELAAAEDKRKAELAAAEDRRLRELWAAEEKRRVGEQAAEEKRLADLAAAEAQRKKALEDLDDRHSQEIGHLTRSQEEERSLLDAKHAAQINDHKGEIARLENELGAALARMSTLEGDVARLEGVIKDREGDIQRLERENESRDARIASLRAEIADLERQSVSQQEQILRAFQKIRADEAVVNKAKKAMAIALTLLDGTDRAAEKQGQGDHGA